MNLYDFPQDLDINTLFISNLNLIARYITLEMLKQESVQWARDVSVLHSANSLQKISEVKVCLVQMLRL